MNTCPCGSSNDYANCCEPIINGQKTADTAEQLMRARYTAHVKAKTEFLFDSTHPDYRDDYDLNETREWSEQSDWHGLEVRDTVAGAEGDDQGEVEFIARFRDKHGMRNHHERARFKFHMKRWFFTEGVMVKPEPVSATKVGRNDPCPCGSGAKHKKCCGR